MAEQLERLARAMRRRRRRDDAEDRGTWHGLSTIAGGHHLDRDAVRGLLIKLVVRGDVEVEQVSNGVYWRAAK